MTTFHAHALRAIAVIGNRICFMGVVVFLSLAVVPALRAAQHDIRSFGARCDGSDDSAAVQAGLDALASGDSLTFSCQAGIGSSGISLHSKSNVTIQGINGGGFKALSPTSQSAAGFRAAMFVVDSCVSCTVRDLTIDASNIGVSGMGFTNSANTEVSNNTVSNAGPMPAAAAIVAAGNHSNRYIGNTIIHTNGTGPGGNGTRGIWLGNPGEDTYEWNPTVSQNTIRDTAHTGIALHTIAAVVTNNSIEGMGDAAGIKITPAAGKPGVTHIEGNTIQNGKVNNQGVQIDQGVSDGIVIRNNVFAGLGDSGVYGLGDNIQILDNTFNDNHAGITVLSGSGWLIQHNTFGHDPTRSTHQGAGVRLTPFSGSIQNVQIVDNVIRDTSLAGIQIYDVSGTASGVTISNNTITNNQGYGILIDERHQGAIGDVKIVSGCFSANGSGPLRDSRSGSRALSLLFAALTCQ